MTNTFVDAIRNKNARTENGMKARSSTASALTDLFFAIGASRGKNIIPQFAAAFAENPELASRIALWVRDVRAGAGERKIFRDILNYLETTNVDYAVAVMRRIPDLGRWDDVLAAKTPVVRAFGFKQIETALHGQDGLAAKWMPRKGADAVELRNYLGLTPKRYRKLLVNLTKVVETQMCAKDWDNINFNHVPSVASSRYKKAFNRHTTSYAEWTNALVKGETFKGEVAKVNASAVYPYDVLKGVFNRYGMDYNVAELNNIVAQWDALPNYVGSSNILPMVDVSGSMSSGPIPNLSPLAIAVSLGLYLADKNTGKFKDTFLTFSSSPELLNLKGNILDKVKQMSTSKWEMSTNLHKAFEKILETAVNGRVPQSEMPEVLLILSDMQFNGCTRYDDSAIQMIRRKYENAGYNVPRVVFWNLNAKDNVPVKFNENGVALVSGFSPSIVKSVLAADLEEFTPYNIMLKTIMNERYNF